jgi:simple sugar transport system substrate-binding protein/ribose transport system substrate-binding protein
MDGGQETFRRIRDPGSLMVATVAVPFELMGTKAVEAIDHIVAQGGKKEDIVAGPYMLMPAVLVDRSNVPADGKWPW